MKSLESVNFLLLRYLEQDFPNHWENSTGQGGAEIPTMKVWTKTYINIKFNNMFTNTQLLLQLVMPLVHMSKVVRRSWMWWCTLLQNYTSFKEFGSSKEQGNITVVHDNVVATRLMNSTRLVFPHGQTTYALIHWFLWLLAYKPLGQIVILYVHM